MTASRADSVTLLLQAWTAGDGAARDRLVAEVYDELRRIARRYMRKETAGHTLQTTELVNEAYLRLIDQNTSWQNRAHFFGIAAQLMRRILVDRARARGRAKRGGMHDRMTLGEVAELIDDHIVDLIELDRALTALTELDPRQGRIVELRFFGGLTNGEIAELKETSLSSVERQWRLARAWLYRALSS